MNEDYKYLTIDVGSTKYAIPIEYAGYIVSTDREFLQCTPPNMPSFVKNILIIENEQALIIDLEGLSGTKSVQKTHPLILLLDYNNSSIGILADKVSLPMWQSDASIEYNPEAHRKFVKIGNERYLLFEVSELYGAILE